MWNDVLAHSERRVTNAPEPQCEWAEVKYKSTTDLNPPTEINGGIAQPVKVPNSNCKVASSMPILSIKRCSASVKDT